MVSDTLQIAICGDMPDMTGRLACREDIRYCQVGEHKTCPLWLVNDPPDEAIYKINLQLDEVPAKRKAALEQAIAVGPPRHETLGISLNRIYQYNKRGSEQ
ncbi:hypothetical protein AALD01_20155 [Oscillospiraceae bacterium 21-37]